MTAEQVYALLKNKRGGSEGGGSTPTFTEDELKALHSGITSEKVLQYDEDMHTHTNKSIIDKLDEYAGNLVYDGNVLKSLNSEIIASEYNSEKTYRLNDIVIRGGALYKRITEESMPNPYYFTTSDTVIGSIKCSDGGQEYDPSRILPEVLEPYGNNTTATWCTTTASISGKTVFGGVVRIDYENGDNPVFVAILMSPNDSGSVVLKQRFDGGSWGASAYDVATVLGTTYYVSFNTNDTMNLSKNPTHYTGAPIIDCTDLGYDFQKIYERIVKTATDTFNPAEWRQISVGGELEELISSNHNHTNKTTLDKLNEYKGNLTYNGVSIKGIEDQVIASEFDSTKEYHKDDLVMRAGKLYKKKSDESQPNPYVCNTNANGGTTCIGGLEFINMMVH